jgi:hypothetical protein
MRAPDIFDKSVPVALDDRAPWFEWMGEKWPDRATAISCREAVHRLEVARAAQPPVINVTVPGVGQFSGTVGADSFSYAPTLTGGFPVVL